ncbi:MAG: electron transfer flavoprotein subunit alpha/FixB family protein [Desulfovibrio sp.]|jgi:electron transfer flavoprotein alpha subunit|nr:electron transfer flavoprotein subunit alpha/FixB family protein [Desulfovibrio sp.]
MRDIWVIAENLPWAAVLIAGAQTINKEAKIVAFVNGGESEAKGAIAHGASSAFFLPLPANAIWEGYVPALAEKAKADKPALILLSASRRCRDVAAQLAALLDAPCFSEGKGISVSGDCVSGNTMVFGGLAAKNASATAETVLVTMGAKDYEPASADASRSGPVDTLPLAGNTPAVTARKPKESQSVNIGEAAKIVSVGRGFADQADIEHARTLARAIGAEVACSRPIAEFFKWMPEECYVGISGQQIKPQLYLAIGISGQAQHLYGVRDAKTIVAVNKDPEALFHQNSDYYIVGDWKEVIPALLKAING